MIDRAEFHKKMIVDPGYFILRLSPEELETIRSLVTTSWINHIQKHHPEHVEQFKTQSLPFYHLHSHLVDHATLWPKSARILPKADLQTIQQQPFFHLLTQIFGENEVSQEEKSGFGEMYWRLVRPNEAKDIGPLHADRWFWDLGHGEPSPDKKRIKVWMALYCQNTNGLRVVPNSHTKNYPYSSEERNGIHKPVFDENDHDLAITQLDCTPGTVVVFNDDLLHGGCFNQSEQARVSLEFTLFVDPNYSDLLSQSCELAY